MYLAKIAAVGGLCMVCCNVQRATCEEPRDDEAAAAAPSAPDTAVSPPRKLGFLGKPPHSGPDNGYVKHRRPPAGMSAAIAWLAAIQDTRRGDEPGIIEIDWLALHAVVDGEDRVLKREDFNDTICGGLYMRNPWFGNGSLAGNQFSELPAKFAAGVASLRVSDRPDKVWHWYGCGRSKLPDETTHVWCEARLRVQGAGAVSLGLDYWRDEDVEYRPDRHYCIEAGDTRYFTDIDAGDWTIVAFNKP